MITITSRNTLVTLGMIALFALMLFFPHGAFADSVGGNGNGIGGVQNGVADLTGHLGKEIGTLPKLIALAAYVIGAFFAVRALFALKGFIEAPDDNPVTKVLGFAAVSALLIMLPYIIGVMANTLDTEKAQTITSSSSSFTDKGDLQ